MPFVAVGGGGGGGFGGGGGGGGALVDPGTYLVRLTAGGQTLTTSVVVLEDIWMKKGLKDEEVRSEKPEVRSSGRMSRVMRGVRPLQSTDLRLP